MPDRWDTALEAGPVHDVIQLQWEPLIQL